MLTAYKKSKLKQRGYGMNGSIQAKQDHGEPVQNSPTGKHLKRREPQNAPCSDHSRLWIMLISKILFLCFWSSRKNSDAIRNAIQQVASICTFNEQRAKERDGGHLDEGSSRNCARCLKMNNNDSKETRVQCKNTGIT